MLISGSHISNRSVLLTKLMNPELAHEVSHTQSRKTLTPALIQELVLLDFGLLLLAVEIWCVGRI